jgi:hypothetical protein
MEIQIPPFRERRQFGRINIPEPTVSRICVPHSRQLWQNQSIIQNISLGGIYFLCDEEPPFGKDDIRNIILDVVHNNQRIYRLKFHGAIVRIEPGQRDASQVAVALKFLADPIYYPFKEINYGEFPSLDKTWVMYQYYQLNRKAYEIIKGTPDIRTQKIYHIKQRINQNLYEIEPAKLAQSVTGNLLEKNLIIHKK